jgi:integrase
MKVSRAVDNCLEYHRVNSQRNTLISYEFLLSKFSAAFSDRELGSITSEEILSFLTRLSDGTKQATKRTRYAVLTAFFTFIRNSYDPELENRCDAAILKKSFRPPKYTPWKMIEKDTVDEIIFKEEKTRDRLLLELMARGGLRVSEALNLAPKDVGDQKLILRNPKSGKDVEVVYIPQKVAQRLTEYIHEQGIKPDDRIFPIGYAAARMIVKKAGERVGVKISPHDLRRHAATYASRAGTPIEIVSKVILRHANLSTTQRYLGKVSDTEARKWIEDLYR